MVVGVDVGGTKTQIVVASQSGLAVNVVVPSLDWESYTWDEVPSWVIGQLDGAYSDWRHCGALVVGAHGCDSPAHTASLWRALAAEASGLCLVVNDALLLVPAAGHTSGIGLVVGTGSIAVTQLGETVLAAGGWGMVLGDEGSSPALVREALRKALCRHDEGLPAERLGVALVDAFGASSMDELLVTASAAATKQGWGDVAPVVFDALAEGSEDARAVIDEAAVALSELVERLVARGARPDRVVIGGGVARNQPALVDAVRCHLHAHLPDCEVVVLREAPVRGALTLGWEAMGWSGSPPPIPLLPSGRSSASAGASIPT